jgi:putative addiction module component (TIGR02574 family)
MPMTMDQIIEEARHLPYEQMEELVYRLILKLDRARTTEIAMEWKTAIHRRLNELAEGRVQAIPGGAVSQRIRQIVGR